MAETITGKAESFKNYGWRVTFAGMGINLALGILYTWSVIRGGIDEAGWGWSQGQLSLPYSMACLIFCLVMVPAGRMQDRLGPRVVASIGGLLVGIGMIVASFISTPVGYVLGFGVLAGAGIGFGYASATPPAVKWFPPNRTGLIAGLVVSGFGLASVYAAPLATWLVATYGLQVMMRILGVAFLLVVVGLAQLLRAPHRVLRFGKGHHHATRRGHPRYPFKKKEEFTPREMLRTWQFYVLWFMYASGAGAGLMIISVAKKIGAQAEVGIAAVVGLAIGNGAGRILAGMLSDKLGRKPTMCMFFLFQAVLVFLLTQAGPGSFLASAAGLVAITALMGANYGANLSLFPSATKDYYGLKNFGVNYGLVFTAWGVGGFMLAQMAGWVYGAYQSFKFAYYCSAALLVLAAVATFIVKAPHHVEHVAPRALPAPKPIEPSEPSKPAETPQPVSADA